MFILSELKQSSWRVRALDEMAEQDQAAAVLGGVPLVMCFATVALCLLLSEASLDFHIRSAYYFVYL